MGNNGIRVKTHYDKAVQVARAAVGMLERKVYPFNIKNIFPDAVVPEGVRKGSKEHALYLFYAVALDLRRESRVVYPKARELYKIMNFSEMHELGEDYIRRVLDENFEHHEDNAKGRAAQDKIVKIFTQNSKMLKDKYGGDPRNLRQEGVDETLKEIRKFWMYGQTNNALLLKNMVRAGIWEFPECSFPIKIDRHVINISLGTGAITLPKKTKIVHFSILVKPLDNLYKKVIEQEKISAIKLNDSLWAIGSYLCDMRSLAYCQSSCDIGCDLKPKTDKKFSRIEFVKDAREQTGFLFDLKEE